MQAAREAARRMQCSNNLKQMGLAVHNFNDVQKGLPPLCVWIHKPGIHLFLFPFAEQQQLYDFIVERPITNNRNIFFTDGTVATGGNNHYPYYPDGTYGIANLSATERGSFNVPWVRCPSYGIEATTQYAATTTYIVPLVFTGSNAWTDSYRMKTDATATVTSNGPFRAASVTGDSNLSDHNKIRTWACRNEMTAWSDGTSNQIAFLEKHMPQWARKKANNQAYSWNGSYLMAWTDFRAGGYARLITNQTDLIAKSATVPVVDTQMLASGTNAQNFFGSYHSGTINALIGDGSVRGISKTVDTQTLYNGCHVSDANVVNF
ncbi:MAG: DUF1559 domain-containing protein [Planctomycetaceae bacterium]|nr:DUF1559 domain-containing protein [Planctomycetaceae bacterium]